MNIQFGLLVLLIQACQAVDFNPQEDKIYKSAIGNFSTYRDSTNYYEQIFQKYATKHPSLYYELKGNKHYVLLDFKNASKAYLISGSKDELDLEHKIKMYLRAANMANLAHENELADSLLQVVKKNISEEDSLSLGQFFGTKGVIANRRKKYKESLCLLKTSLSCLEKDSLESSYIFYLNYMGISYQKQSFKAKAADCLLRSLRLAKEKKMYYMFSSIYYRLAKLYRESKAYEEALNIFDKYKYYAQKHKLSYDLWRALDGIAITYAEQKNFRQAEFYFKQAIIQTNSFKRVETKGVALTNLGRCYRIWGKTKLAKLYLHKALNLRKQHNLQNSSMLKNLSELSEIAVGEKQFLLAEKYLIEASHVADVNKNFRMQLICQKKLAEIYESKRDFSKSNQALKFYSKLEKEMQQRNQDILLRDLLTRYETKEKKKQIVEQAEKIHFQTIAIFLLLLALTLITILALFLNRLLRRQKKYNDEIVRLKQVQSSQRKKIERLQKSQNAKAKAQTRLLDLLDENMFRDKELSLKSLAQILGTNTSYLSEIINKEFQCNFKTFLAHYRVEWCKEQLIKGKYSSIKQMAFDAGFASTSSFYATFKAETGMTPAIYKKTYKC